jgi:exodeoxyribonuclease-3
MRIATWNINGLNARMPYLLAWLKEVQPDVVALQELKMSDQQFPHEALAAAGYRAVVHGQKGWNGVAVLGRGEVGAVCVGLPGQEGLGARLLTARVDDLLFTSVYCPNGKSVEHPDFAAKLHWFDALVSHIAERHGSDENHLLCGDFNIVPAALDSWNEPLLAGGIFHTEAERSRLGRLLSLGFRDLFRECHPGEPGFTWWDYRAGAFHKGQGLRIDLLLGAPAVARRVRAVHVERRWRKKLEGLLSSDHAPVWADLE